MIIRPASEEDLAAIEALAKATPHAPAWTAGTYQRMLQADPPQSARHIVLLAQAAESDGLLGFAVFSISADEAELEAIAVLPVAQRKGIGKALLHAGCNSVDVAGARVVHLEVRRSNSAAVHLYRTAGFLETGLRPRYYTGPVEDAVLMQWRPTQKS